MLTFEIQAIFQITRLLFLLIKRGPRSRCLDASISPPASWWTRAGNICVIVFMPCDVALTFFLRIIFFNLCIPGPVVPHQLRFDCSIIVGQNCHECMEVKYLSKLRLPGEKNGNVFLDQIPSQLPAKKLETIMSVSVWNMVFECEGAENRPGSKTSHMLRICLTIRAQMSPVFHCPQSFPCHIRDVTRLHTVD